MPNASRDPQPATPSLLDVLARVARGPDATSGDGLTALEAATYIRQIIEDAQPDEFHADTEEECAAWMEGVRAYHGNLLRAFQIEDEFAAPPATWEIKTE